MEIDCQPEDSMVSTYDEECVGLGDVKDMRLEAEAVVSDVLFAVAEMHVSQGLNSALDVAYINVETREGNLYCLELTEAGLRVRSSTEAECFVTHLSTPEDLQWITCCFWPNRWWDMPSIKWTRIWAPSIMKQSTRFLTRWVQVTEKHLGMLCSSGWKDWSKTDNKDQSAASERVVYHLGSIGYDPIHLVKYCS